MALIEIYHVVADMYPIAAAQTIREGMCVRLNAAGEVIPAIATLDVMGLAGDSTAVSASAASKSTPYSAQLTIGANSDGTVRSTQWTQNRVSDAYNETLASGKMTVYHGGGKFATDQYDTTVLTFTCDSNTTADLYSNAAGLLTNVNGGGQRIGRCVAVPTAYPSGVPGTDTTDGSLSLGTFITLILIH